MIDLCATFLLFEETKSWAVQRPPELLRGLTVTSTHAKGSADKNSKAKFVKRISSIHFGYKFQVVLGVGDRSSKDSSHYKSHACTFFGICWIPLTLFPTAYLVLGCYGGCHEHNVLRYAKDFEILRFLKYLI